MKRHFKRIHENKEKLKCIQCENEFASRITLTKHIKKVHEKK